MTLERADRMPAVQAAPGPGCLETTPARRTGRCHGPNCLEGGDPPRQRHQVRTRKVANAEHIATAKRMKADGHTSKDIAKDLGVSPATLYRYLYEEVA